MLALFQRTFPTSTYFDFEINEAIQKQLDEDIHAELFDSEVRDLIAFWILEINEVGYEEYMKSPWAKSFNDHINDDFFTILVTFLI